MNVLLFALFFLLKHFYTFFLEKRLKTGAPEKSCSLIFCAVLHDKSKTYMSSSLEDSKDESSGRFPHLGMLMGLRKGGMLCRGWSQEPPSFLQWEKAFLPALKHFTLRNTCTLQIPHSKSHSGVPSKLLNIMAINPMVVTASGLPRALKHLLFSCRPLPMFIPHTLKAACSLCVWLYLSEMQWFLLRRKSEQESHWCCSVVFFWTPSDQILLL